MGKRYDNILGTVGNTPVVRLEKLAPPGVNVFVKIESFNPMGSVKDRLALGLIEDAERRGELRPGQTIVEATSGDTGERHLSTPLFDDVPIEMTDEEVAISKSTASYRFDVSAASAPAAEATLDEAAIRDVEALLADPENPIVMFALEWCEFCWSVRKMLAKYEIPYRSVDIDSVAYKENDRGGKIRQVLKTRTGWQTIPLIFVGGELVGGCTDVFDRRKEGSLAQRLEALSIPFNPEVRDDPYSFLPGWPHPR